MIDRTHNSKRETGAASQRRRSPVACLGSRLWTSAAVAAAAGILWLGARSATRHPQILLGFNPEQDTVNGQPSPVKWQGSSVTWEMNCSVGSNVQVGSGSGCLIESPIKLAFAVWNTTPLSPGGPVTTNLTINEGPQTNLSDPDTGTSGIDCVNIVSFMPRRPSGFLPAPLLSQRWPPFSARRPLTTNAPVTEPRPPKRATSRLVSLMPTSCSIPPRTFPAFNRRRRTPMTFSRWPLTKSDTCSGSTTAASPTR